MIFLYWIFCDLKVIVEKVKIRLSLKLLDIWYFYIILCFVCFFKGEKGFDGLRGFKGIIIIFFGNKFN